MGEGGSALDSHENWCEISRRSEIYKNPRESCCKIDILQKFDYRYKKYHGQIWISKKPIHFGHICWVFILFLVNTWTSMVPWFLLTTEASNSSPGSAHFSPMASQALCHGTCDGTVAISERNGSAQVGFYMLFDRRLPIKLNMDFCWKTSFWQKRGRFFAEFYFFFGGGLKWLDVTLLRFFGWRDTYSWVLEVCFGAHQYPLETSLVPKRTSHEPCSTQSCGPQKPRIYCFQLFYTFSIFCTRWGPPA